MISIYNSLFSHSSEEGHLGGSNFLTATNKTAVNMCGQYVKIYHTFHISNRKSECYGSCVFSF